jgi:hypothetical protein
MYRLVSLCDSLSETSSFIKDFLRTFRPMDNVSVKNIYAGNIHQFFADLFSTDSTVRAKAHATISNIYYRKQEIPELLTAIRSLRYGDKDYFDSKSRFIAELGYIKDSTASPQILTALKDIYEKTADTGTFQNKVLQSLAKIKTKASYNLLKELILLDPPVFESDYEYNTFFTDMADSLPLAKQLFPEILQLSSIEDYKENVNTLLVSLLKRDLIAAKDYENYYTKIYFDARIQMKKLQARDEKRMEEENSKDDGEKQNYSENPANSNLEELEWLLMPFYDTKPPVRKLFDQLLLSRDPIVQLQAAVLLLKNKRPVPEKLLLQLAGDLRFRARLFSELEKWSVADKFPSLYRNQLDIAKGLLVAEKPYDKLDSIVFLQKQGITYKGKKGKVYFFKYRMKKDDEWKIGISGMQPDTLNLVSSDNTFANMTDKKLKTDEPVDEQLETQLKRLLFSLRKSSKNFYTEGVSRFKRSEIED